MKKSIFILSSILIVTACAENPAYNRTPLYRDISGQNRSDGQLAMSAAYCRNMVNSHVQPYEGPRGPYMTDPTGESLNQGLNAIRRGMSGPNYNDCMLSQGFELAGYE